MNKYRNPASLPILPARVPGAHKGDCGRVLVVAGSWGMLGAACLTAEAALRAGAGLVTLAVPERLVLPASIKLTEVILEGVPETAAGTFALAARKILARLAGQNDVVALGPGLSTHQEAARLAVWLYRQIRQPMVADADALNALAAKPRALAKHAGPRILTPHPGEMARLVGRTSTEVQSAREQTAQESARAWKAVVALKGSGTVVTDGDFLSVNDTGNPGMATAGTGDVLAGVIAGLWAQKMPAFEAARLGVHLHGLAGDLAVAELGEHSLTAGDLLAFLPKAFLRHSA